MKQMETKLSLEQYVSYYLHGESARGRSLLSRFHLNYILQMHGFARLHHHTKANILGCLESVPLIPPTRSTLWSSSCHRRGALLTPAEVATDLDDLGWQECPFRSIYNLDLQSFREYHTLAKVPAAVLPVALPAATERQRGVRRRQRVRRAPPADFVVAGRRPRSKRRTVSVNALNTAFSTTSVHSRERGEGESAWSTSPRELYTPHQPLLPLYPRSRTPSPPDSSYSASPSSPSWVPSSPSWTPSPQSSPPPCRVVLVG